MVTDLSRFARPAVAVTAAAGRQIAELLFTRQAEEMKLRVKFEPPAKLQLKVKFQLLANLLQVQAQAVVPLQARPRPAAAE